MVYAVARSKKNMLPDREGRETYQKEGPVMKLISRIEQYLEAMYKECAVKTDMKF